ncbi:MAG: GldG family protein [Clostridiales bacterium]|nr:GldG family protein [Clostridiales bacterium]
MKKDKSSNRISKKKLQYGSISIVLVIVFIASIVLINAGVSFLTDRYNLKADISAAGLYEISEQTEIMLKNLKEPVTAYILLSEDEVSQSTGYAEANELLKRYASMSNGKFTVQYVDIYKNPTFTQNFETDQTLSRGSFIIESPKRFKVASLTDLYEISTNYDKTTGKSSQYYSGFAADQSFASALHYVTTEDLPTVAKIVGHNERYAETFLDIFESNNYYVQEINLMMEDIPADVAMIIIGAPTTDYTMEEIDKIDNYLVENHGSAIVFSDMMSEATPNLDLYYEEWSVKYNNEMALDATRAVSSPIMIAPMLVDTTLTENLPVSANDIILAPYSRTMDQVFESRGGRTSKAILRTSDNSYAKPYSTEKQITTYEKEAGDTDGPLNVAVLCTLSEFVNNTRMDTNVLFFGTSAIASDSMLGTASFTNLKFLTSAIDYMNPMVDAVSIEAKDFTSTELIIMEDQARVIFWVLIVALPLVILALGFVVWIKRRNK